MPKLNKEESRQVLADLEITTLAEITDEWVGRFCSKLHDPIKKAAWIKLLAIVEEFQPEAAKRWANFAKGNKGMLLEFQGAEPWYKQLGALTFTRPFALVQQRFLEWNWRALMKVRKGIDLDPTELIGFQPWPRETGKSSITEWSCIAEGAILRADRRDCGRGRRRHAGAQSDAAVGVRRG